MATTWNQTGFRFRNDDGSESAATWKDAENTNITVEVTARNVPLRVRIQARQTGSTTAGLTGFLRCKINAGSYLQVNASSTGVESLASGNFADEDATTNQLTGTPFVAGKMDEVDGSCLVTGSVVQNSYTEHEYSIQLTADELSHGDVLSFEEYRTSSSAFSTYTQVGTITIVKAPVPAQYAANPSDPVRARVMLACLLATCVCQPPLVPNPVPPPAVCCWDCWKPGPTKESAATPWLWQSSTDPLNKWIPVVAAVPSVDKWVGRQTAWILSKLPRAGGGGGGGAGAPAVPDVASWFVQPPCPTTAARVGVGRYLDCAQPPLAAMPAPAVDRWVARNADPTIGARATPWSWPNKGEIITASIPAPVVSQWYTPPPGPTPATRAKPQFYPSWGGFFTAALPAPTVDRWCPAPNIPVRYVPALSRAVMATCYGQPPPVIPAPTIDRRIVPQPGPIIEAAATPWRWQTSTEPVGAWTTPVDTRAYPDRWQTPIPGPIQLKRATPWLYQATTEPLAQWITSIDVRAYPDRWSCPQPGPTQVRRATPWLTQPSLAPQILAPTVPSLDRWFMAQVLPRLSRRATPWLVAPSAQPLAAWIVTSQPLFCEIGPALFIGGVVDAIANAGGVDSAMVATGGAAGAQLVRGEFRE